MGFFKRIFSGIHRSFFIFAAVVTVLALLLLTFGPGNNLIEWAKVRRDIAHQEKQIRKYRLEIQQMDHKIKMLSSDRDSLERFARENFHFSAPDEDIYILDE